MQTRFLAAALSAALAALSVPAAFAGEAPGIECDFALTTLEDGEVIQTLTGCTGPVAGPAPAAAALELPDVLEGLLTLPARVVDLIPMLGPERENDPQQWKQP